VVVRVLLAGVTLVNLGNLFYAAVHGLGRGGRLYHWFALGAEGGIPTWFSAALLLVATATLAVAALDARDAGRPFVGHWLGLAAVFVLLSVDEVAQIHEGLGGEIREHVELPSALTAAGVIPGLVLAGVVAVLYGRFLLRQGRELCLGLLLAGALYVGGAAGVEAVAQARNAEHHLGRLTFFLLDTLEENLEMLGVVLLVAVVTRHLAAVGARLTLSFGRQE
jgi:hypothetical protein